VFYCLVADLVVCGGKKGSIQGKVKFKGVTQTAATNKDGKKKKREGEMVDKN